MKNNKTRLLIAGLFLCAAMPALAQEKTPDEKKLESASAELEKDAASSEGNKTVTDKLKSEFKVDDAVVQGLRDQKLGYGEVSTVLTLAQGLPGGITDANLQKVVALRQGPPVMGWGKVAKELGLKLGPAVSKVKRISAEARKQEKADKAKKEKKEKAEKAGKPERPEKREKAGKPEKGGRPETHGKH